MSTNPQPSVKQQRAAKRSAQLEEFKRKEAARKRGQRLGAVLAIVGVLAVIAVVVTIVVINSQPKPATGPVTEGLQTWTDLEATHVDGTVRYEMTPPAGGPHNPVWLNCGVYDEPQVNENAVHALEHGAIWITYDPTETDAAEVSALRALLPSTYAILSPYPGIGPAMAISAWGAQLRFTDVDDPDVADFITTYWRSGSAPEPGAPCTGGIDGPGRVS